MTVELVFDVYRVGIGIVCMGWWFCKVIVKCMVFNFIVSGIVILFVLVFFSVFSGVFESIYYLLCVVCIVFGVEEVF